MNFDEKAWAQDVEERSEAAAESIKKLVKTIAALRHPKRGCPWDLQQDHRSLRHYMLEEAYEAAAAMLGEEDGDLLDELGDVLLQVVLNAQLASERKAGDLAQIVEGLDKKMRRRHPHVFASEGPMGVSTAIKDVKKNWELIKEIEKCQKNGPSSNPVKPSLFADESKIIPALTQAYKIGKKAKKIHFDWIQPKEVLKQLRAELEELEVEIERKDQVAIEQELGDVFFTLAQLSRHLGTEPESAAQRGNQKFLKRFHKLESLVCSEGKHLEALTQVDLESFWQKAKLTENK